MSTVEIKLLDRFRNSISTEEGAQIQAQKALESFSNYRKLIAKRQDKWFHVELENILESEKSAVILLPRGFGKSTTMVDFMAYSVAKWRDVRIVIATNALRLAMEWLREVENILANDAEYRRCFGDLVPSPRTLTWTDTEKTVLGRSPNATHTTFYAISVGGTALGKRADIILVDDILEPERGVPTEGELSKVSQWFWKVLYPILEPNGKIFVFGTHFSSDDLYSELIRKGWKHLVVSALDENMESIWPERFPTEELLRRRADMGSIMFDLQYQNKISTGRLLKEEWLRVECDIPDNLEIYQGVDPCISPSASSDYFAMFTIGISGNKIYLLDLVRARLSLSQQIEIIQQQAAKWQPRLVGIETNASQLFLKEAVESTSIVPVKAVPSKSSKINRFIPMAALFESGRAVLKGNLVDGHPVPDPVFNSFVEEWLGFPDAKHDDCLDALEKAITIARFGPLPAYVDESMLPEETRQRFTQQGIQRTPTGLPMPRPLFTRRFEPLFRRWVP